MNFLVSVTTSDHMVELFINEKKHLNYINTIQANNRKDNLFIINYRKEWVKIHIRPDTKICTTKKKNLLCTIKYK